MIVTSLSDNGAETLQLIEQAGGAGTWVTCDVTDRAAVDNAVAEAVRVTGRLDGLVHNAFARPMWEKDPRVGSRIRDDDGAVAARGIGGSAGRLLLRDRRLSTSARSGWAADPRLVGRRPGGHPHPVGLRRLQGRDARDDQEPSRASGDTIGSRSTPSRPTSRPRRSTPGGRRTRSSRRRARPSRRSATSAIRRRTSLPRSSSCSATTRTTSPARPSRSTPAATCRCRCRSRSGPHW